MPPTAKLISLLCLGLLAGCARRSLSITSDPPNALVYLNGQEVGRTPMKYDFNWYGDYDIILRKDGFTTLKTHRDLKAPLYAYPPIDLFSELFGTYDKREWTFTMEPVEANAVSTDVLINRATALKDDLQSTGHTRPPTTLPVGAAAGKRPAPPPVLPATQATE